MAIDDYRRGLLTGLSLNKNLASGLITSDYNELENTPIYVDDYGLIQINPIYQTFFDSLGGETSDYNNLTNIPLTLVTAEDGTISVAVNSNYQDFFTSLSKDNDTIDYNAFINVPLFLDKDGSITINEAYKEFFKNLIKEAVTELPIASAASLGGIKIGEGLTISEDGVLSVTISPSISSNNGVLVASIAEILEDKNLLINDTILSDNSYMTIEGQITNNTIIGGIYSNV